MMKRVLTVLCCVAAMALAQTALADVGVVTPLVFTGEITPIGDIVATDGLPYDNRVDSGFYFAVDPSIVPTCLDDDIPLPNGPVHVNTIIFGYVATDLSNNQGVIVTAYGGTQAGTDLPDPTNVSGGPFALTGLPGSPDGTPTGYEVTVDLAGQGLDFDWVPTQSQGGTYFFNWLDFAYDTAGTGPILATGGGSQDVFAANNTLSPPMNDGVWGLWFFGGNPQASFHIALQ